MRALPTGTMATDKCVLHAAQMPKGRKYIEFGSTTTNFIRLIVFFYNKNGTSVQTCYIRQEFTIDIRLTAAHHSGLFTFRERLGARTLRSMLTARRDSIDCEKSYEPI